MCSCRPSPVIVLKPLEHDKLPFDYISYKTERELTEKILGYLAAMADEVSHHGGDLQAFKKILEDPRQLAMIQKWLWMLKVRPS